MIMRLIKAAALVWIAKKFADRSADKSVTTRRSA